MDQDTSRRLADGKACLEHALKYLDLGWSVLPLCYPDHIGIGLVSPKHSKSCQSPGKRPWILWKRYEDELPAIDDLHYWWQQLPSSNVGIALGPVSGLIRVDIEGAGGEQELLRKSDGDLPKTLEFKSGRADGTGRGLLFKIPAGVSLRTTYDTFGTKEELRFQARGAQTVLPPSRHQSGSLYAWTPGLGPDDLKPAIAPAWLLKELETTGTRSKSKTFRSIDEWKDIAAGVPEGTRNSDMAALIGKYLGALRDINNDSDVCAVMLSAEAINERNDPPMDDEELQTIFMSILKAERKQREQEDLAARDREISQRIEHSSGHKENGKSTVKDRPDWDLQIVRSEPIEYRLRTHYWVESLELQDGYLVLSSRQILNWSTREGIHQAAWDQAGVVVPVKVKVWSTPGGHLEKLRARATVVEVTPESRRQLYILGFIYRYLAAARPSANGDGKPHWPPSGRPTKDEADCIFFKLANLKSRIKEAREDFAHREVTRLLEDNHFEQCTVQNSRWWKACSQVFTSIGLQTKEANT
jgi:hypothetical protein